MMNLRKFRWMWLLPLVIAFTGCLTIEENYTFKKDGSGTMEYVVDASELFRLMKDMPGKEKTDNKKDDMGLKEKLAELRAIAGISKVKMKEEEEGAIQRVRFAFADVDALNRALGVLLTDSNRTDEQRARFSWEGGTLVRTNTSFAKDLGESLAGDPSDTTGAQQILQSMHYKYSFKFAKEINDTQHAEGVTQENVGGKEVRLTTDFGVITKDPQALDLRISLK
jgi:hypothetical protein